jgi:hypothetical protein
MSLKKRVNEIHLQYFPQIYVVTKNLYEYFFFCLNKASDFYFEKRRFRKKTGYSLHLENPRSFNEKIIWKKVHDRNPLLPKTADKFRVRSYVKELLGEEEGEKILIPLLYVTDNSDSIPFDTLPKDFVIKANHGNGWNIIVRDGKYDKKEILKKCKIWVKVPYGLEKMEWGYKDIKRKIMVEKLLTDRDGKQPADYKFHIFHNKCKMIQINQGNPTNKKERTLTLYTPYWKKIDVFWEYKPEKYVPRPENLDDMILLAEKISEPFDYVRVDLYSINGKIYLGELTHYPTSGMALVKPLDFDFEVGKYWKLKK